MSRTYPFLMILMFVMMSCVDDVRNTSSGEQEMSFTASFGSGESTKTILVGGKDVHWLPGDCIYVSGAADPLSTDITEPSADAVFSGFVMPSAKYYAVYPYGATSYMNGELQVSVPSEQTAVNGSFANNLNVSAAVTSAQDMNFRFQNLLGYMKFTIGAESGSIVSVKVEANSGDAVAGTAIVNFDPDTDEPSLTREQQWNVTLSSDTVLEPGDYYMAMLPGTFPTGLTLTFTDDQQRVAEKYVYSELTLEAGTIQNIGTVKGLIFEQVEDILLRERQALIDIYNAAGGENWTDNTNWCSDLPVGEWRGVDTDINGYVVSIDFLANNLKLEGDSFPSTFANLEHLKTLYLQMESSVFPDVLFGLERLSYLELHLPTYEGEVPAGIEDLKCLKHLGISGGFTSIPEALGSMTRLEYLQIFRSWTIDDLTFSGGIPESIANLSNLKHLNVGGFDISAEIPEWIYDMTNLEYLKMNALDLQGGLSEKIAQLNKLKTLDLSVNKLGGPVPNGIVELTDLEGLYLYENNFTGTLPEGFIHLDNLIEIWIYGNRLSGDLPYDFEQNINYGLWGVDQNVLLQQGGYVLNLSSAAYESTDFSSDCKVMILQEASVGEGVNLVLLGDGFLDMDMGEGGAFEEAMQESIEHLFSLQPMKAYKNYFNIYAVKAVSKHERFAAGYETALGTVLGEPPAVAGDMDACVEYALKAPVSSTEDLIIAVVVKSNIYVGTTYWFEDGMSIAFVGMARPVDGFYEKTFGATLIHEVVGHGIGKLADEYVHYNETYPGTHDEELRREWLESGECANVDVTDDRNEIRWAHMLKDERYSSYTGIVEGGDLFAYGIWRPEERSMMRYNDPYFNAPSREALVKRIVTLAGETHTFEKFAEKDVYEPIVMTRSGDIEPSFVPTPPPVIVNP